MTETCLPVFDLFAFAVDCDLSITEGRLLTRDLITCVFKTGVKNNNNNN